MQLVSCENGRLYTLQRAMAALGGDAGAPGGRRAFVTGFPALDALAPSGSFARGAVHEILAEPAHGTAAFFALLLAKAATVADATTTTITATDAPGALVWSDPRGELYPPAVVAAGVPLGRLYLLRPGAGAGEQAWAVAECLRCAGVGATVAQFGRLSRVEARRLQLAAERGGGVGLFCRPAGDAATTYAAVTRWLVAPAPAGRGAQRWAVRLMHGHGGRVGQSVLLEHSRETNHVRVLEAVADRPPASSRPPAVARRIG